MFRSSCLLEIMKIFLRNPGSTERQRVDTTWHHREVVDASLEGIEVGLRMVRLESHKKVLDSLWLLKRSHQAPLHLLWLDLCSLHRKPLPLCECMAQTLRCCLECQNAITKEILFRSLLRRVRRPSWWSQLRGIISCYRWAAMRPARKLWNASYQNMT